VLPIKAARVLEQENSYRVASAGAINTGELGVFSIRFSGFLAFAVVPLVQLVSQRSNADTQQVRRMRSITTCLAQGMLDVFLLDLLQRDDFRRKGQGVVRDTG
jgi:hypothetical protein